MADDRSNQLLGELLTEAGVIQIDDLREAAHIARNQKLPIGKVLVMSGYISKELLHAAVEVQSRLKDNLLNYELGLKALASVSETNCSLEDALAKLGSELPKLSDSTTYRLGALLIGSALVSQADYDIALAESQRNGLPLGRVLTNLSMLSEETIDCALDVQRMLRAGQISKDEAIQSLVVNKERKLNDPNCSEKQTITADKQTITSVLSNNQGNNKDAKPGESAENSEAKKSNKPFPVLDSLTLHHMLLMAGLVETNTLENAIKEGVKKPEVMGLILKQSGILEEFVIDAAQECCQLIASGQLKPEQAIIALHHCQRTRNSIKDCLAEFDWTPKSEIRW